jgi:ADP-ribosylglycohydrolase
MLPDLATTPLYRKALGCLLGGLIGDAMGTPTEGKDYREIEAQFGWVDDFTGDGTDDTVMKYLLAEALIRTGGHATMDAWAQVWLDQWDSLFGSKKDKFFISVLHTAQKLKHHATPRMAALGNMPSSSSAMCISPVGIVNAANPRAAALQAYHLAALIHTHDVGFCQDGAACMAAAVAAAFEPEATVESVLYAALRYVEPLSGREMLDAIAGALDLARSSGDYVTFRAHLYESAGRFFHRLICDSRETIPLTFALFLLAEGDVRRCVTYGANLGRDADTIASMAGAIAGALRGIEGIPGEWVQKARRLSAQDQERLALDLARTAITKQLDHVAVTEHLEALYQAPAG